VRRVTSSLIKFSGCTKADDASLQPIVEQAVSVMFPGNETVYDGTIVGLLASQRGRRIVLVDSRWKTDRVKTTSSPISILESLLYWRTVTELADTDRDESVSRAAPTSTSSRRIEARSSRSYAANAGWIAMTTSLTTA